MENVEEVSLKPEVVAQSKEIYDMLAASAGVQVTEELVDRLMQGAMDFHVHAGPETYAGRTYDEAEIAVKAVQESMGAVVFKCHSAPSSARLAFVRQIADRFAEEHGKAKVDIHGGVVLNRPVGGINPYAVEASINFGGRFVWTPTIDSAHHKRATGSAQAGIEVVGEDGKLVPELYDVFKLIAENDAVLSISHQSTRERFLIIEEARRCGVTRILVDHPQLTITKATPQQMREMAERGAYIGLYYQAAVPNLYYAGVRPGEVLEIIKTVGVEHLVGGTDLGQVQNPDPVYGMRLFFKTLLSFGVSEKDIRTIFAENGRKLLY